MFTIPIISKTCRSYQKIPIELSNTYNTCLFSKIFKRTCNRFITYNEIQRTRKYLIKITYFYLIISRCFSRNQNDYMIFYEKCI